MDLNSVLSISQANIPENKGSLDLILAKAKKGDQAAFSEIYELFFKKIYKFIFYRVSHKEVAEDLSEEVFLKAYTKISTISEDRAFEGWLYQIARNLVIDYYRQKKIVVPLDEIENTLEYESNIVDTLNLESEQKILLKFLKELSPEQQIIIKLKFLEGLENTEIAEILNKTEGSIRVVQHRAITKLQELIQASGKI